MPFGRRGNGRSSGDPSNFGGRRDQGTGYTQYPKQFSGSSSYGGNAGARRGGGGRGVGRSLQAQIQAAVRAELRGRRMAGPRKGRAGGQQRSADRANDQQFVEDFESEGFGGRGFGPLRIGHRM